MARLVLSHDAYCHLFLHASKHPTKAVNGLLLGSASKEQGVTVAHVLPLFHSSFALAPMLEVALMLVRKLHSRQLGGRVRSVWGWVPPRVFFTNMRPCLMQADEHCKASGTLELVGYYQANELSDDLELGTFGRKIADKIRAQCPSSIMLLVRHALFIPVCPPSLPGN